MCCCSVKQQRIWIFSVGSILMTLGVIFVTAWPTLFELILSSVLPLRPSSFMFSKWVITPIPLYFNFYMSNWTNPHLANDSSVKPNFEELGPYVFREVRVKEDLKWNNDENIVTFIDRRTWYFEASKSNGSLEDMITAPHLPTIAGGKIFKNFHPIVRKIVNYGLNREGGKLAVTHNARKWLFDGFYDDILDFVMRLHSPISGVEENQFTYLNKRNDSNTAEETFSINTGKANLNEMGDLKYWNGLSHTKYWEGECGRVNGTTGELWAPARKWHDPSNENYRGVEARRYASTELTFDSGHKVADTKCFCVKGRECPKIGAIDFSTVSSRAPIYLSHPHFNMADPLYRENTTGLNPDPQKHVISVILEPKLGIPLDIDGRVLLSVLVEKDEQIDILKDLAWNFYAPLFYLQIQATITDDLLRIIKFTLNLPQLGQYLGIALIIIGLTMIGAGVFVTIRHKKQKELDVLEKRKN